VGGSECLPCQPNECNTPTQQSKLYVPFLRAEPGRDREVSHRIVNAADVIDGRYRLERLLGTGGMSEVWLAEDERLGRQVAVKIIRDTGEDLGGTIEREARLVARLQHPNIVSVFDAGQQDGNQYLVAEYIEGSSLRDVLQARGRLTEAEAVRYGIQVARALQYAHSQGIVHCDVKPENILISSQGIAKVTDFGVADMVTRTVTPAEARDILGTIAYLAPEVIQGAPADARSDIYSLGLTIYELVAGRLPFTGASAAAIAGQRLGTPVAPLRTFAADASRGLEVVLARAVALSPADRYQTAAEFEAVLRAAPPPVRPVTRPAAAAAPPRRHDTARVGVGRGGPRRADSQSAGPFLAIAAVIVVGVAVGVGVAIALNRGGGNGGQPTPVPSLVLPTPQATPTATVTPTATPTPSPSASPSVSPSPTPTNRTPTPSPTLSGTATATPPATRTTVPGTVTPAPTPTP
jgi:serine/threonine protein kinase